MLEDKQNNIPHQAIKTNQAAAKDQGQALSTMLNHSKWSVREHLHTKRLGFWHGL